MSEQRRRGFSLIELMLAMAITSGIGLIVFQLFLQNERIFREQNLFVEMQQSARAAASMMTGEIRMAGQGVPVYSASQDAATAEAAQAFLSGTGSGAIVFRAGVRNAIASVQTAPPLSFTVGASRTLTVDSSAAISSIVGGNSNRFLFIWGPTANSWSWVRAEITAINTTTHVITMTPRQTSGQGPTFSPTPNLALEEAIAYRLSSGSLQRATSRDFSTLTAPALTYSAVGNNFTSLAFNYYDGSNNAVNPSTLAGRAAIRRVDFTIGAQTSEPIPTTGAFATFAVTMKVYPRNVALY